VQAVRLALDVLAVSARGFRADERRVQRAQLPLAAVASELI